MEQISMLMYLAVFLPIFLSHLQTDPIDPNSTSYQFGRYLAYVFMAVFVVAIIYAVVKRMRKK